LLIMGYGVRRVGAAGVAAAGAAGLPVGVREARRGSALAIGISIVLPPLEMPPLTRFVDGTGPVFAGKLFPFAFITIACGAISGFHALISSGHDAEAARARA
jgi:hypothetical protein